VRSEAGIASVVVAVPRGAEIFSVNVRSIPMPRLSDRRMASRRDDHVEMKTEDQLRA
jgi:hypothetical protein